MANAAYAKKVMVTTSNVTADDDDLVGGLNSANFNRISAELDATEFDGSGLEKVILGVKGVEIPLAGDFDSADTGQARLLAANEDRSSVWLHYAHNGINGWKVECKVPRFDVGGGVKDKETFSATCKATGAVAAIS